MLSRFRGYAHRGRSYREPRRNRREYNTGNGPASAMLFALAIVEKGINAAKAAEVASGMLMK